nr:hypothetical protein [Coleofasciculus sp. FACHB-129]
MVSSLESSRVVEPLGGCDRALRPPFRPLALAAPNPALLLSRIICLSNESDRAEDAEDQLTTTGSGVDAFGQADKSDARGIEVFDQCQQILKASTQPVKSPYKQAIPVPEMFKILVKSRS